MNKELKYVKKEKTLKKKKEDSYDKYVNQFSSERVPHFQRMIRYGRHKELIIDTPINLKELFALERES